MDLGEFRKLTKDLSDNTEIASCDGIDTWEIYNYFNLYPSTSEHVALIVLDMGQRVDLQFDLDNRETTKTLRDKTRKIR